eukprot:c5903_g1_i1.p1 GENE.c5903_g1_i1~~c5903_g1_i1.p1  ORF type:complete len:421 (+),score=99.72 c5903_g1_i1:46-1263(+)
MSATPDVDPKAVERKEKESRFMMDLAQTMFVAVSDYQVDPAVKAQALDELLNAVIEKKMTPVAEWLLSNHQANYPVIASRVSEQVLAEMKATNTKKLEEFDQKAKDAQENLGENDYREALLAKADYFRLIGDKTNALQQYKLTEEKTMGVGPKLDMVFSVLELAMFWDDSHLVSTQITKAKKFMDDGGDWERRNRLKVYEAVHLMRLRRFKRASELLQESIATFTCTELMTYNKFIFYTVVMSLVSCDRPTLKSKVVHAPEILQVIREMPQLQQLMQSLYECKYRSFFEAIVAVSEDIGRDCYLSKHYAYYLREMRLKAYSQFLESYSSVSLESMAATFGVSADFLDSELSRFICSGTLPSRIDKISGLVESQRPDSRNATYQQIIKDGDLLLNRVQKLSRVINV